MSRGARAAFIYAVAPLVGCGSNDLTPIDPPSVDAGASSDATSATDAVADGSHPSDAPSDAHPNDGSTSHDSAAAPSDGGTSCKRGIASNIVPTAAFAHSGSSPGISWWYNWSEQGAAIPTSIEFDPMIWGAGSLNDAVPAGSPYVLGFNEPNFKMQSDLTPQQVASDWPAVEANARAVGAKIVSPGVNFCGSASDTSGCSYPSVTDPYTFLKDFFAACPGCEVDAIAVHWYNCDLPSLQAYIDGNSSLEGFVQFGKPIWLTEFSCGSSNTVAEQQTYMQAAIPYLEGNANVERYSWFSSTAIPNAQLANGDGSLTALGTTYVGLTSNCP
jgi:Glycosyl hydrolase catalytic core